MMRKACAGENYCNLDVNSLLNITYCEPEDEPYLEVDYSCVDEGKLNLIDYILGAYVTGPGFNFSSYIVNCQ